MRKAKKGGDQMQTDLSHDRVTLRVKPEDMDRWKEAAEKEQRSLSNWITWMVKKAEQCKNN